MKVAFPDGQEFEIPKERLVVAQRLAIQDTPRSLVLVFERREDSGQDMPEMFAVILPGPLARPLVNDLSEMKNAKVKPPWLETQ